MSCGRQVRAVTNHWVTPTVYVRDGDLWAHDDLVVVSHPDWFTPIPTTTGTAASGVTPAEPAAQRDEAPVEQATAAPGEKRAIWHHDQP